ncbi:hypothetical protein P7C70_g680, partial [Phenoliferia sp. Uapishka_3]
MSSQSPPSSPRPSSPASTFPSPIASPSPSVRSSVGHSFWGPVVLAKPLVVILLHGDVDIFEPNFFRGSEGGRALAHALKGCAKQHLEKRGFGDEEDVRVCCFWIYNKQSLVPYLLRIGSIVDFGQFDQFLKGCNSSPWPFACVDAGTSKNSTASKVLQYLNLYLEPHSSTLVLLGGLHLSRYADVLRSLSPSCLSMVTLVRTTRLKAVEYDDLSNIVTTRDFQRLFDQRGRIGGASWTSPTSRGKGKGKGRVGAGEDSKTRGPLATLNSSLTPALHACNDFYLRRDGCVRDETTNPCPYSHSYTFTDTEWADLPLRAKRTPCKSSKRGGICPDGNDCIWGHTCAWKEKDCPHGRNCWFAKAGMGHAG